MTKKEYYTIKMLVHDYKLLLGQVRNCNRRFNCDAPEPDSIKHIYWHHLTGLIPSSRMYEATSPNAPFLFQEQLLLQKSVAWPVPQAGDGYDDLNATQVKVVHSMAQTNTAGMFHLIGPPGTGKTTTITRLLLERMCHFPGEKILLAAPSNKAIQVVLHKLIEKNSDGFAIAVIGTGKGASPEHDKYYAAECLTPMLDRLKALRRNPAPWNARRVTLQKILNDTCDHIEFVMDPSKKGLQVTRSTQQLADEALQKILDHDLSAIADADTLKKDISKWINLLYNAAECVENYILERAQVIFSTLVASGRKNFHKVVKKFHTVIVDEAAQALMAETFIPFKFNPIRYLLVGDPSQLPATVSSRDLERVGYADSLMHVMKKEMGDSSCAEMLTIQYRMHSTICKPISDLFYGGKLVTDVSVVNRPCLLQKHLPAHMLLRDAPCAFIDLVSTERKVDDGRISNDEEAELVVRVVLFLLDHGIKPHQIGVVAGYNAQVDLLENLLRTSRPRLRHLTVSSIDGFQGGEKDFMLFSCVRTSEAVGFMKDERRVNVALSRGRYANWIFGQARTWRKSNSPLQRIINWIEDENRNCLSARAVVVEASALLDSMRDPLSSVSPALHSPVRSSNPAAPAAISTPAVTAVSTPVPAGQQHSLPVAAAPPLAAPSAPSAMAESTSSSPAPVAGRSAVQREGFAAEAPHGAWARDTPKGTSTGSSATRARQRGPPAAGDIASIVFTPPAPSTAPSAAVSPAVAQTSAPPVEQAAATRKQSKQNRGKVLIGAAISTGRRK